MTDGTERIYMNDCERWETESGHEYRSGDPITIKVGGEWITTRVECRRGAVHTVWRGRADLQRYGG